MLPEGAVFNSQSGIDFGGKREGGREKGEH